MGRSALLSGGAMRMLDSPARSTVRHGRRPGDWVDSPAWRLIHALAPLTDREGERLSADGLGPLFDRRKEIVPEEGELWNGFTGGSRAATPTE